MEWLANMTREHAAEPPTGRGTMTGGSWHGSVDPGPRNDFLAAQNMVNVKPAPMGAESDPFMMGADLWSAQVQPALLADAGGGQSPPSDQQGSLRGSRAKRIDHIIKRMRASIR